MWTLHWTLLVYGISGVFSYGPDPLTPPRRNLALCDCLDDDACGWISGEKTVRSAYFSGNACMAPFLKVKG